jgi:hypothetical protein
MCNPDGMTRPQERIPTTSVAPTRSFTIPSHISGMTQEAGSHITRFEPMITPLPSGLLSHSSAAGASIRTCRADPGSKVSRSKLRDIAETAFHGSIKLKSLSLPEGARAEKMRMGFLRLRARTLRGRSNSMEGVEWWVVSAARLNRGQGWTIRSRFLSKVPRHGFWCLTET